MENNHPIPRTIKIGVTGPSKIPNIESVPKKVNEILQKIDDILTNTPYSFIVISPLTKGSDRILADEILNFKGSVNHQKNYLEVVLRNNSNKNIDDDDFCKLIDLSISTKTLDEILSEDIYKDIAEDYTHAGQVIVDECDILIAITNEKLGDTSYIVDYAVNHTHKPTFTIKPYQESATEDHTNYFYKTLEYHNIYNKEKINPRDFQKSKDDESLINKMNLLKLDSNQKKLIEENILQQFLKASTLAGYYQNKHYYTINIVYIFSAASISVVAIQLLFLQFLTQIYVLEAFMMLTIITLFLLNKKNDWHRKWIDYRYLAERLRAAIIFSMTGLECKNLDHLPHQQSTDDWTLNAYESVYTKQLKISNPKLNFDKIKNFILKHYIISQKNYYQNKSTKSGKKDEKLNIIIYTAFAGALIAAIIHTLNIQTLNYTLKPLITNITTLIVIIFPAIAASCAGIRIQHEYLRTSKRYHHMESYLQTIEYKINNLKQQEEEKLIEILGTANKMMLREHQDWRTIFSARGPELP